MRKIYVFRTAQNNVNWDTTRELIINNPAYFSDGNRDYGAGSEPFATCAGCSRQLPMIIFHLDHIQSQARYAVSNMGIKANDAFVILDNDCDKAGPDVQASATGGVVRITSGSIYAPRVGLSQAIEVWRSDLNNLQLLCGHCNTSKGAQDWISWGRTLQDAKPLARTWKNTAAND